jgi:hypothetical protein
MLVKRAQRQMAAARELPRHPEARALLRDLPAIGRAGGIELIAPYAVLRERITQRVVCPACDPQRRHRAFEDVINLSQMTI